MREFRYIDHPADSGEQTHVNPCEECGILVPTMYAGPHAAWHSNNHPTPAEEAMPKECVFRSGECTESASAIVSSPPHAHTVEVCASHIWWGLTVIGAPGMTMTVRLL